MTWIASTISLKRVKREMKRRLDVVGVLPDDAAVTRSVGAPMLDTDDEWAVARCHAGLESLAGVTSVETVGSLVAAA